MINIKVWEFIARIAEIRSSEYPEQVKEQIIKRLIKEKQNEIHNSGNTAVEQQVHRAD